MAFALEGSPGVVAGKQGLEFADDLLGSRIPYRSSPGNGGTSGHAAKKASKSSCLEP
jgi:hypothetical protein